MKDCMLDLETLGRRAGCIVLSIGAVMFDDEAGTLGPEFYTEINQQSCLSRGLYVDHETAEWWKQQNNDAQQVLRNTIGSKGTPIQTALTCFADFLREHGGEKVRIWGNGANFDQPILAECYAKTGIDLPWKFWNDRCYRTLKNLVLLPETPFAGVKHNALADAKHQAIHAIKLLTSLRAKSTIVVE